MATATRTTTTTQATEVRQQSGNTGRNVILAVSYALLILLAVVQFAPFIYALSTSFKTNAEAFQAPLRLIPEEFSLEGYQMMNSAQANVPRWAINSAIIAAIIMLGHLLFDSIAGYALARMHFPGRNLIFLVMLGTMMIPGVVLLIPRFIVLKQLGLLDTLQGIFVPGLADVFGIFLMKQFFETVPQELEEAAFIDGANRLQMFFRVILPTAGSALAALAIFSFQGAWNDFMGPLIVVTNPDLYTLPLGLALLRGAVGTNLPWNFIMAGSILTTVPMALIFLFFQRYFVEGVSYSGIKG